MSNYISLISFVYSLWFKLETHSTCACWSHRSSLCRSSWSSTDSIWSCSCCSCSCDLWRKADCTLTSCSSDADVIILMLQMSLWCRYWTCTCIIIKTGNCSLKKRCSKIKKDIFWRKVYTLPVVAVWYWRQSRIGIARFPQQYCVTLICQLLVVDVEPSSISMFIWLQESEAGTHMCCPVL